MEKDQFLLRPNKKLIERLKMLAEKYGKPSGQQVMLEVVEQYLDFWEEAEESKQATIRRQRGELNKKASAPKRSGGKEESGPHKKMPAPKKRR
jgi:predicted DNA-binding protein